MKAIHLHSRPDAAPRGWPLFRLGFRPFYLGAAVFGSLAVPLWIAVLFGQVRPALALPPMLWHAHEMLFGFATAVIVGFLLTAGKAWTGHATPRGPVLAGLAALWLGARLAGLGAPYTWYAALDLALLPLVGTVFLRLLLRAGNHRNLPVALILLLLALANAVFHLAHLGVLALDPLRALQAGLALIVMMESVIAGRVVPAFTQSATPGLRLRASPGLERVTLAATAAGLAGWVFLPAAPAGALALAVAAVAHGVRQWRWQPWVTRGRPILWVLHAGYLWLPVGLGLLALAQAGVIAASTGQHALAVGATGVLVIGMMTRTARGHTGRPIRASVVETCAYALVIAAAVLRVLPPLLAAHWTAHVLVAAAVAWSLGFGLYAVRFAPWLIRTRLDGKDG